MRIQILQHSDVDTPALVNTWAISRGHLAKVTHLHKGEIPLDPNAFDFLVILGGDMNVDQEAEFPWLKDEKKFLETCLKKNKTTLGICLGGQLIAEVLGAKVKKNDHWEVGWHPVKMLGSSPFTGTWPKSLDFFHWHECTFELPSGAELLASSDACANQAYTYGKNVFATQFHPEADEAWVLEAVKPPYPPAGRFVQTPKEIRANLAAIARSKPYFFELLDSLSTAKY
jgi:GMP synthase-like glutamine amidotransferase